MVVQQILNYNNSINGEGIHSRYCECVLNLVHKRILQLTQKQHQYTIVTKQNNSSFRFGVLTHIVPRIEVVLGNGEVRVCDARGENKELYYLLAASYGTLGIVVSDCFCFSVKSIF
jgi:hypothetical protein